MSERLNVCPFCKSTAIRVLEVFDPDTTNLNSKARVECEDCWAVWIDWVTSAHTEDQRAKGFVL
jgi:hypothetical protein